MRAVIALIFWTISILLPSNVEATAPVVIPPMPQHSPEMAEAMAEAREWALYWLEAHAEYEDEFTALFNSYTYTVSKNGRSMVNGKFVAMPKGK